MQTSPAKSRRAHRMAMAGNNESAELPPSTTVSVFKELSGTREEVERARGAAVQAWLASMPLGEELERLRAELDAAKTRLAATAAEIPQLKSQIESTNGAIGTRQEAAARKTAAAEDLRRHVDGARAELRKLLAEVAASRGAKDALEQRVLVRRQALRALQLAERAIAAEAHALAWSEAAASELTARARGDVDGDGDGDEEDPRYDVVTLPARKLVELRRLVDTEERKAEARVEEAEEARRAVKARRMAAVARLDAARAKRRVASETELRRRGNGDDGRGTRARSALVPKSRSGRCFAVKKLQERLCKWRI